MQKITIVNVVEAYTWKQRNSIWIVPGDLSDFELQKNEERWLHINDYLTQRGINVAARIAPEKAAEIAEEVSQKFSRYGIDATVELLCND